MLEIFECGQCGSRLQVRVSAAGKEIECPRCKTMQVIPRKKLGPDMTVGGFRIKKLLGRGGMGEVYLARQLSMDREVALKILPSSMTQDEETVQRFLNEVRMAARLEHPHIVTAFEAGEDEGVYYMAMSYVKGETLADVLADGHVLREKDALAITRHVASALAYAWDKHHMLHRDVKPANIILDEDGDPKLTDMGLCKTLGEKAGMTLSGVVMGTPNYMSPEQSEGFEGIDFRSDMYSLGATLYHMLTGKIPFDGSSMMETLRKQATESLPDPRKDNPHVSKACVSLIEVMLAKDPAKRHQSWGDLQADVDRVAKGLPIKADSPGKGQSVLARLPSKSVRGEPGTPSRKHVVLGHSTLMKLHDREKVRRHPPTTTPKPPPSKSLAIAIAVVVVALLIGGTLAGVHVAQKRKLAARRAAVAAQLPREGIVILNPEPPSTPSPEGPDPAVSAKPHNPQNAVSLQERFDAAVAYVKEHPDNVIGAYSRFETLRRAARGTKFERAVDREIARLQERQQQEHDAGQDDVVASGAQMENSERKPPPDTITLPVPEDTVHVAFAPESVGTDAVVDALLALDLDAARTAISAAGSTAPHGTDPERWGGFRELALNVTELPKLMRVSLAKDIGKTVSVRLKNGPLNVKITGMDGTTVVAEEHIIAEGKKIGEVARSFDLADLSVQEQFRRLGKGVSPDRLVMRGLLAYAGNSGEMARQYLQQSKSELGALLIARIDAAGESRRVQWAKAKSDAADTAAGNAYTVLLRVAGFSVVDKEVDELVMGIRQKVFPAGQVLRVREVLGGFHEKHGTTAFAAKQQEVLDALGQIHPNMPLYVSRETLDAALEKVRRANPGNVSWKKAEIETDGIVLDLSGQSTLVDISALKGLPIKDLHLGGSAVADLSALENMPLKRLNLWSVEPAHKDLSPLSGLSLTWLCVGGGASPTLSDLGPLKGMPLRHLDVGSGSHNTLLEDLSPLKGMPLESLNLWHCRLIEDLSVLAGMPLVELNIGGLPELRDLSPLRGMPLEKLILRDCRKVTSISVLKGMPLTELIITASGVKDISPVMDITSLQKLER